MVATTQIRRGCPVWSEVLLGALINLKALHELNHFLMFFVNHFTGWLEPLVSRIAVNETNVAVPIIDIINDDTFELKFLPEVTSIGGFNWELIYTWHGVPEKEMQRNEYKKYLPIRYG